MFVLKVIGIVLLYTLFITLMAVCFKLMAKNERLEEDERKRKFYNDDK